MNSNITQPKKNSVVIITHDKVNKKFERKTLENYLQIELENEYHRHLLCQVEGVEYICELLKISM